MTKKNVTMIIKYDFQIDTGEINNGKILTFLMREQKFGSFPNDLFDINFFLQVGHSLLPALNAVIIQSWQK